MWMKYIGGIFMEHMKLQFGCLIILLYVAFVYFREVKRYHYKTNQSFFDELLIIGITSIVFDGMTAYTVNHIDMVPSVLNRLLHTLFLISIDSVIFFLCLYMLYITGSYPKKKSGRIILFTPFVINILVVILNIDSLEYYSGKCYQLFQGYFCIHLFYHGHHLYDSIHNYRNKTLELYRNT